MSAIVVAGGGSKRFGQEKCLAKLAENPLLLHVLNRIPSSVDEIVVVIGSHEQQVQVERVIQKRARARKKRVSVIVDTARYQTPLVGALAGFEATSGENALLLPCDTPFLSSKMLFFLWISCKEKDGIVPRWPNGDIEPLHAAYNVQAAKRAASLALSDGRLDMRSFLAKMQRVQYVPVTHLKKFDPELQTFFNINTHSEMQLAGEIINNMKRTLTCNSTC